MQTMHRVFTAACFLYPSLFLATVFAAWCAAALHLGQPPTPSIHDPKSIAWPVSILNAFAVILLVGSPLAAAVAFVSRLSLSWRKTTLQLSVMALAWAIPTAIVWSDPAQISTWFMD